MEQEPRLYGGALVFLVTNENLSRENKSLAVSEYFARKEPLPSGRLAAREPGRSLRGQMAGDAAYASRP